MVVSKEDRNGLGLKKTELSVPTDVGSPNESVTSNQESCAFNYMQLKLLINGTHTRSPMQVADTGQSD